MRKMILVAVVLSLASSAWAYTLITDFSDFTLGDAGWGSWPGYTYSGPTTFDVETYPGAGWGGGWHYNWPLIPDASAETTVELQIILHPGCSTGIPLVVLQDGDGTQYVYNWLDVSVGTHTLTRPINNPAWIAAAGGTPGLDLTFIQFIQIQGDFNYTNISWDNLALTPEPTSLVVMGLGALVVLRRR
jgi:hypothetical protein